MQSEAQSSVFLNSIEENKALVLISGLGNDIKMFSAFFTCKYSIKGSRISLSFEYLCLKALTADAGFFFSMTLVLSCVYKGKKRVLFELSL